MNRAVQMSGSSFVYGVDFGMTTSSLAIMWEDGELALVTDPAVEGRAEHAVRTAVWAPEDPEAALLVGQAAVNAEEGRPLAYRDNFKRDVRDQKVLALDSRRCEIVDAVAAVLRFLYEQAQDLQKGAPEATVLTAPVEWRKGRREILRRAAISAGYPRKSLFIEDEPAAAIEYARRLGIIDGKPRTLVYDLGGSTVDCLAVKPGPPGASEPRSASGAEIGGINFDRAVMDLAEQRFPAEFAELRFGALGQEEPWLIDRVERACEGIKRRLSGEDSVEDIFYDLPGRPEFALSTAELNAAIADKVDETINVAEMALKKLGLSWQQVDAVLPVGGSTRVPLVHSRLHDQAPGKLLEIPEPNFAVAYGAAVMARQRADDLAAGRRPASAQLATARPWKSPPAIDQPVVADAAGPPQKFNRHYLAAIGLALVPALASTGLLAWRHWALPGQIIAGLLGLPSIALGTAFAVRPARNSSAAGWLSFLTSIAAFTFLVVASTYSSHHEKTLGFWSLGTAVFLMAAAVVSGYASARASRARTGASVYAHHQEVIRKITDQRWFGGSTPQIPDFLLPLFQIPALRGFQVRAEPGEEQRYLLAAGGRILLVAMLTSRDQRPVLEQWEGSLGYRLPPFSAKTVLVAPGTTPPQVAADEAFNINAMITTRGGVVNIVGSWLESDNRLVIPLLSAVLRSVDSSPAKLSAEKAV